MYNVHEMSKAWPKPSPIRRLQLKQSLKEVGLLQPLLYWIDDGTPWCIDGDTRQDLIAELHAEGVIKALNGKKLDAKWERFKGTELQALDVVKALNGANRRHMRPSQLAMVDVENYHLELKYTKRLGVELPDEDGEVATVRSRRGGYNRSYWFQCNRIRDAAPDLAKLVREGTLNIPKALAELRKRAGECPEPSANGDSSQSEVRDGLRQIVTQEPYRSIMADRAKFKQARKLIVSAIKLIDVLRELPSGKVLAEQGHLADDLRSIAVVVDRCQPYCLCPVCAGKNKKCPMCAGKGYVTKVEWKTSVPDEYKVTGDVDD